MQEMREVELPYLGPIKNMPDPEVMLSISAVAEQEADAAVVLAPLLGVPLPMIVMPIFDGTAIPLVHVQVPDGI